MKTILIALAAILIAFVIFGEAKADDTNATVTKSFSYKWWGSCQSVGMSVIELDNGKFATVCRVMKVGDRINFDMKDNMTKDN